MLRPKAIQMIFSFSETARNWRARLSTSPQMMTYLSRTQAWMISRTVQRKALISFEVFLLRNGEKFIYDKVPKPIEKQEKMT